jgi:gamma-glutamyltranspeptidase/glutathione hydrolase
MNEPAILLEQGTPLATLGELENLGHQIIELEPSFAAASTPFGSMLQFGAAQMISKIEGGYIAASDPRRDGQSVGF